jgi:hypothetical protein
MRIRRFITGAVIATAVALAYFAGTQNAVVRPALATAQYTPTPTPSASATPKNVAQMTPTPSPTPTTVPPVTPAAH